MKKLATIEGTSTGLTDRKRNNKSTPKVAPLSLDDQATVLLLKTCGAEGHGDHPVAAARQLLGEHFVAPLQMNLVDEVKEAFGMQGAGGADVFSALVGEVDKNDE